MEEFGPWISDQHVLSKLTTLMTRLNNFMVLDIVTFAKKTNLTIFHKSNQISFHAKLILYKATDVEI